MLPPLPAIPLVSADTRLAYVLRHFQLAFPAAPTQAIGYAAQRQVTISDGAGQFFEQHQPHPPAPNYREWLGQSIPFFFDAAPDKPLLEQQPDGHVVIHADVISAAFYLLSGWQEFFSGERDRHGRFPYAASVQHQYGFVTVPVVNYYFDVLKTAVEQVTGQPLAPRRWGDTQAPFATFVTHDIDNLYSAWKQPATAALRAGNLLGFGRKAGQHFTHPDAWDNLAEVQQIVASYGAKSTVFFLPEHRPGTNGTPNADYQVEHAWPRLAAAIGNSEVALHGSIGRATHADHLRREQHRLRQCSGHEVQGNRFHYLSWEPRLTPAILDSLAFRYDSTLGFAEHFGFRNSYCGPFHPFDFSQNCPCRFLEIPLNVMDATLYHPNYLQLAPDEILPALQPMFEQVERFGGVCTVLWHNENFDPANEHNGPREFHSIMEYLRNRNTAFLTGQAICEMMNE